MAIRLFGHDIALQSESCTELQMFGYDIVPPTKTRRHQSAVPDDLLLDVLLRLPAKTLGRFRCVSKSWGSLIVNTNRYFSNLYLNNISTDYSTKIIVCGLSNVEPDLYTIDCKTKDTKKLNYPSSIKRYIPNNDQENFYPMINVEGSINGVLFIRSKYPEIGIWNPLSQRYQEILCPPSVSPPLLNLETFIIYGFGYEKTSDDYKVVALQNFWNNEVESVLPGHYHGWIYSLKLNTWKRLQSFSYALYLHEYGIAGVFVSGALHWITEDISILGFNLIDENFYLVPKPPTTPQSLPHLSVLGNCLSFSGYYGLNIWEIWVMNDYGIKDSWSKINLSHGILESTFGQSYGIIKPVAYLVKKQVLILHVYSAPIMIMVYDLVHHSVDTIHLVPHHNPVTTYPYRESLE